MTTQIWLHSHRTGSVTRAGQSKLARRLLQLACLARDIELSDRQLSLPGPELMDLLASEFQLAISIAHCAQLTAIAIGKGKLGLDCETTGKMRNWPDIASCFFTPEEARTIANTRNIEIENIFLRHWVLKESYIKSIRGSVFGDLNRLNLVDMGKTARVEHSDVNSGWAWVGSFAGCVLGIYGSHCSAQELTFHELVDINHPTPEACHRQLPGAFVAIE